eukprot:SAG22_NODE_85_length_21510_cov_6.472187_16_plen_74_part_00
MTHYVSLSWLYHLPPSQADLSSKGRMQKIMMAGGTVSEDQSAAHKDWKRYAMKVKGNSKQGQADYILCPPVRP